MCALCECCECACMCRSICVNERRLQRLFKAYAYYFLSRVLCLCLHVFMCACMCMCERSAIWNSRMSSHLKALGADFLAFLHPGDSGFGLPGGLAHKRRNSAWDACLVLWGFDKTWQAWGGWSKGSRGRQRVIKRRRRRSQGQGKRVRGKGEGEQWKGKGER